MIEVPEHEDVYQRLKRETLLEWRKREHVQIAKNVSVVAIISAAIWCLVWLS